MKTIQPKKILLPFFFLIGVILNAQDVHFSQTSETPLLLNPAQAALGHDIQVIVNYKDQWRSFTSPYRTLNVSGDFAVMRKSSGSRMGIGVNVFSDKAGDGNMGTTTGQLHLSGVLAADDKNLVSAGISGGYGQRSLQYDKLYWDNQYDGLQYNPGLPSGEPATFANHGYADLSAGLGWFFGKDHATLSSKDAVTINAGFALHHINRPAYSFYGNGDRLPMKMIAHGKACIGVKNYNLVLEPSYLVMIQGGHHEITPGMMFRYMAQESSKYTGRKKASAFALGGYWRLKDAFIACARYEFSTWSIGTSYDFNVSDLRTASKAKGGFEISLRFLSPDPFGKGNSVKSFN